MTDLTDAQLVADLREPYQAMRFTKAEIADYIEQQAAQIAEAENVYVHWMNRAMDYELEIDRLRGELHNAEITIAEDLKYQRELEDQLFDLEGVS